MAWGVHGFRGSLDSTRVRVVSELHAGCSRSRGAWQAACSGALLTRHALLGPVWEGSVKQGSKAMALCHHEQCPCCMWLITQHVAGRTSCWHSLGSGLVLHETVAPSRG